MSNTIIDLMRIPTDSEGWPYYDMDEINDMIEKYHKCFPDRQVFAIPDRIKVWEDLDIDTLRFIKHQIDELITLKETEENQ